MAAVLTAQFVFGCALFNWRNEDLPAGRNVKTIVFPVRLLKYSKISCTQEYENVELSGTLINGSPYTLPNVGVQTTIFFAGETPTREFILSTTPSTLLPSDTATFTLTAIVDDPVARVELHAVWDQPK